MKKLLSITLALAMLLTSVLAISCGDEKEPADNSTTTTTTTTTTKGSDDMTPPEEGGDNQGGDNQGGDNQGGDENAEAVKIATAAELVDFAKKINDGSYEANTNAVLTADIDMAGLANVSAWEPMYVYSGVFDGAGYTIKNLSWTFTMENSTNGNMPLAENEGTYVIKNTDNAKGDNSFADAGVALLVINLDGGEIKNLKMADCSTNVVCSYNKNYNTLVAGLAASVNNAKITNCELTNVTVNVPKHVNYNQGQQGYAAIVAARAMGDSVISQVTVSGAVNTSENVKFNAAPILGYFVGEGSMEISGCTSTAAVTVCPEADLNTDELMWKTGDGLLGGRTGELYVDSSVEVKTESSGETTPTTPPEQGNKPDNELDFIPDKKN